MKKIIGNLFLGLRLAVVVWLAVLLLTFVLGVTLGYAEHPLDGKLVGWQEQGWVTSRRSTYASAVWTLKSLTSQICFRVIALEGAREAFPESEAVFDSGNRLYLCQPRDGEPQLRTLWKYNFAPPIHDRIDGS